MRSNFRRDNETWLLSFPCLVGFQTCFSAMKKEAGKDTPLFGGVLIGHFRPVSVSTNATLPAITIHPMICDIASANPAIAVPDTIRVGMSFHSLDSTVVDILRFKVLFLAVH